MWVDTWNSYIVKLGESGHRLRLFTVEEDREDYYSYVDSNPDSMTDSQPDEIFVQAQVKHNVYYSKVYIEHIKYETKQGRIRFLSIY